MTAPDEPAEPVHQPPAFHGRRGARASLYLQLALAAVGVLFVGWLVMNADLLGLSPSERPGVTISREAEDAAALRARIAELEQALAEARATPAAVPPPGLDAGAAAALLSRVERLEATQRRASRAASAAIAAAALADAAQTSRPFLTELAALERLSFDPEQLRGLRPLARTGAPTRAALAAEFPAVAARAAAAARRTPTEGTSFLDRALGAMGSLFTLRRVDTLTGSSPDAVLARAERRAVEGDIEGALEQLEALPPVGKTASSDWRERARRRVELEQRIAALRAEALSDLAEGATMEGPQP